MNTSFKLVWLPLASRHPDTQPSTSRQYPARDTQTVPSQGQYSLAQAQYSPGQGLARPSTALARPSQVRGSRPSLVRVARPGQVRVVRPGTARYTTQVHPPRCTLPTTIPSTLGTPATRAVLATSEVLAGRHSSGRRPPGSCRANGNITCTVSL